SMCSSSCSRPLAGARRVGRCAPAAGAAPPADSGRAPFLFRRLLRRTLLMFCRPVRTCLGTSLCPGWSASQRRNNSSLLRCFNSLGSSLKILRKYPATVSPPCPASLRPLVSPDALLAFFATATPHG